MRRPKNLDISGQKFNRLTAIRYIGTNSHKIQLWEFKCDCGTIGIKSKSSVANNWIKSCGCLLRETSSKTCIANIKHKMCDSRVYKIYHGMKSRCNHHKNERYINYGGRGISVGKEFKTFQLFYDWAIENGYQYDLSIDRIDVNGNYTPENCRWATDEQQINNKTNSVKLEFNGEIKNASEWADIFGLCRSAIYRRLKCGWSVENAISKPARFVSTPKYK